MRPSKANLFLSVNIRLPGANWNNRPNDIYFANRFLSETREFEYTWVLADIDRAPSTG